jgi:hypothetical protein
MTRKDLGLAQQRPHGFAEGPEQRGRGRELDPRKFRPPGLRRVQRLAVWVIAA